MIGMQLWPSLHSNTKICDKNELTTFPTLPLSMILINAKCGIINLHNFFHILIPMDNIYIHNLHICKYK